MSSLPSPITTDLELKEAPPLNEISDAQHIDTSTLRKCQISTTIKNIEYGTLTIRGEAHEACIVHFCFEVVGQQQPHAQRIQDLDIVLRVSRAAATHPENQAIAARQQSGQRSSTTKSFSLLEIRYREPVGGKAAPSKRDVTFAANIGGQVGFQYAGVDAGFPSSEQQETQAPASLDSHLLDPRAVSYRLQEDAARGGGVPGSFECALVLRTDRMPFDIGVTFTAVTPFLGSLWKRTADAQVLVGESYLGRQGDASAVGGHPSLQQMESDAFKNWLKSRICNDWIVDQP